MSVAVCFIVVVWSDSGKSAKIRSARLLIALPPIGSAHPCEHEGKLMRVCVFVVVVFASRYCTYPTNSKPRIWSKCVEIHRLSTVRKEKLNEKQTSRRGKLWAKRSRAESFDEKQKKRERERKHHAVDCSSNFGPTLRTNWPPLCVDMFPARFLSYSRFVFYVFFFSLTKDIESLDALISVCVCRS